MAIYARRIVFVIDVSGSMHGPRIATAKRELLATIDALPEKSSFNIVVFSSRVAVWQNGLMPATAGTKAIARAFVYGLHTGGETAAYDALETAFRFDAEAVYFLTDGQPNAGKIPSPPAILDAVARGNRTRRISIYTIGIAPGRPGSMLDTFVSRLAEQNWGLYRRVEQ
jgi:Ca-activated chloride channel family protein